jgi:hypothetical protein
MMPGQQVYQERGQKAQTEGRKPRFHAHLPAPARWHELPNPLAGFGLG